MTITQGEEVLANKLAILLYGDPGSGKTSISFSASNPILFDFDGGVHRSEYRTGKAVVRIKSWSEIQKDIPNFDTILKPYDTVIIDTVDSALQYMKLHLEAENVKDARNQLRIYGKLKEKWFDFLFKLKSMDKNVILLAHDVTEDVNGSARVTPKITGGSKDIVWEKTDVAGYMSVLNNKKTLTFESTDFYVLKNPGKLDAFYQLPDYNIETQFLQGLIDKSIVHINAVNESLMQANKFVAAMVSTIEKATMVDEINEIFDAVAKLESKAIRQQLWSSLKTRAAELKYTFNNAEKRFETVSIISNPDTVVQ
jgi:GTPase SAR1 family protein